MFPTQPTHKDDHYHLTLPLSYNEWAACLNWIGMSAGEQGLAVVMDANILNPTILDISFDHWNSFWKHFSYPARLLASPSNAWQRGRSRDYTGFCFYPHRAFGFQRSSRCGRQTERWRDRAKVQEKRKQRGETRLNWEGYVVRKVSVTQLIACWWLRVVSAVSSSWFMDSRWTPAAREVGRRGRSQRCNCNGASIFFPNRAGRVRENEWERESRPRIFPHAILLCTAISCVLI